MKPNVFYGIKCCLLISFLIFGHFANAEADEITILIGRNRDNLAQLITRPPVPLAAAVSSIGGTTERTVILIVRSGNYYVLGYSEYQKGGRDIRLKAGDEVSFFGPSETFDSFRKEHPSAVIGIDAVKKGLLFEE